MLHGESSSIATSLERGVIFTEPLSAREVARDAEPKAAAIGEYAGSIAVKTLINAWRVHCNDHPEDTAETLEVGPGMTATTLYDDETRRFTLDQHHEADTRDRLQRILRRDLRRYARNYFQTPIEIGISALRCVSAVPTEDNKTLLLLQPDIKSADAGIQELRWERAAILSVLRNKYDYSLRAPRDVGVVLATLHCPPDERQLGAVLTAPVQARP